jgi:hypothetical protein
MRGEEKDSELISHGFRSTGLSFHHFCIRYLREHAAIIRLPNACVQMIKSSKLPERQNGLSGRNDTEER